MPTDSNVWIVLIIVAGLVTALAIWFGRGLRVKKKGEAIDVELQGDKTTRPPGIQVANNAKIEKSHIGDIAGVKIEGTGAGGPNPENVQVFNNSKLKDVEAGDVAGIKRTAPKTDKNT